MQLTRVIFYLEKKKSCDSFFRMTLSSHETLIMRLKKEECGELEAQATLFVSGFLCRTKEDFLKREGSAKKAKTKQRFKKIYQIL